MIVVASRIIDITNIVFIDKMRRVLCSLVNFNILNNNNLCIPGDLITRRTGDNIDGYPLLVGIYSLLRQSKSENVDIFIESLCNYVKLVSLVFSK